RELSVAVPGQGQGALAERVLAELLHDLRGGVGVEELVRGQRAHLGQRDAADDVRQVAGRRRRRQELVELVLGDGHELDLDVRRRREAVDDRLRGGDAVGQVLLDPDLDAVGRAVARLLVSPAGRQRCGDRDGERTGAEGADGPTTRTEHDASGGRYPPT